MVRLPGLQGASSARRYQALTGPNQATGSAGGLDYGEELSVSEKPHDRSADTADDVGKMRNVACGEQAAQNLLRQV